MSTNTKNQWADTIVEGLFTAAANPRIDPVSIEGVGTYYVRCAANDVRDQIDAMFGAAANGHGNREGLRALVICGSLCDQQGRRMKFDDKLLAAIGELDSEITEPLYIAAMKANRMWKVDQEDAEKNSGETTGDEPGSS